ncbi:MAG: AsmA family protein, partial [Stenotrophobium sp.]
MSRPFKILLIAAGAIVGLFIIAAIALPLLFNPNNYRKQLTVAASDQIHRDLTLGDIKLSVFPWLRVKVSDVKLGNAPGFGPDPFATAQEMSVGVRLLPLIFDKRVEASAITLDGLHLNLAKNAKGGNNWSDLSQPEKPKPQEKSGGKSSIELKGINIGGIEIDDANIDYNDAQARKHYAIEHLNFKTGSLSPGKPFDVALSLALSSTAPQALIQLKLDGKVLADTDAKNYTVNGLKLTAGLSGAAVPGGKQEVQLTGDLDYNQAAGTAKFSKGELQAAGLTLNTEISGENLNGDAPKFSGPVSIKPFSPRNIMAKLGMTAPVTSDRNALTAASLSAQLDGSSKSAMLNNLNFKLDQTTLTGNLGLRDFSTQAIVFALKADKLDADGYMAPKSDKPGVAGNAGGAKSDINSVKIPTGALDALNVNGSVDVGALKISGLNLSDVHLTIAGPKNSAKQQALTARLYGGQLVQSSRIGGGRAVALKTQLQTIDAGPLLKDFLGKDYVSGIGSLTLDLNGSGATVGELRKALDGSVGFNLKNGAVKGFNLGQIIRNAQALMAGQQASAADNTQKETDFASLSASGKIINGVLKSDDLDAKSPVFRLAGAGQVDLANETIDYLAKPTVVESSSGQGGKALGDLRGLTIPIQLSGNLFAPSYKVQLNDLL